MPRAFPSRVTSARWEREAAIRPGLCSTLESRSGPATVKGSCVAGGSNASNASALRHRNLIAAYPDDRAPGGPAGAGGRMTHGPTVRSGRRRNGRGGGGGPAGPGGRGGGGGGGG